jgi:Arc/MetJ-type ribon-helix-helix transcriptional regulator
MPIISVRISGEEKKELEEYGPLSSAVREGVKLYLQSKKTSKAHAKL